MEHYSFKMFCAISPYFDSEPSPSMNYFYLFGVRCFSPSPEKDSPSCSCSSLHSSHVKLFDICCDRVYEFVVVWLFSRRCRLFRSILALLFFLRFWLMGAASPWVGTEFSLLRCCLPRRWFAVDSPWSSWLSRSVFL